MEHERRPWPFRVFEGRAPAIRPARDPSGGAGVTEAPSQPREPPGGPSVRRQLIGVLALAIAPALALAAAYATASYEETKSAALRRFEAQARAETRAQRDALVSKRGALEALAAAPAMAVLGEPACDAALAAYARDRGLVTLAVALDPEGRVRCASRPEAAGRDFGGGPAFRSFSAAPRFRIDHVSDGAVTGESVLVLTLPLRAEGAPMRGALAVSIPERAIWRLSDPSDAADRLPLRHALVDAQGAVLTATPGERAPDWRPAGDVALPSRGGGPFLARSVDGREMAFAAFPVADAPFLLLSGVETEVLFDGLLARAAAPVAAPVLVLLIAVVVCYVGLERLVIRHLVHLARWARAYGEGRAPPRPRAAAEASREIAMLRRALDDMARGLAERQDALARASRENEALLVEVLHRVGNNLQTIGALLNHEIRRGGGRAELRALRRMQGRLGGIAAVQELLYGGDASRAIPLDRLLGRVARERTERDGGGGGGGDGIALSLAPREETADRALSLALFVNEALEEALEAVAQDGRPVSTRLRLDPVPSDGGYRVAVTVEGAARTTVPETAGLTPSLARRLGGRIERRAGPDGVAISLTVPESGV